MALSLNNGKTSLIANEPGFVARGPYKLNKPGTAQVGAISKAQKDLKTTFSTTGDNKSSQKTKN